MIVIRLAIDFFLDFFNLVAEGKVELKVSFNFFDAMHNGGVIFDANFVGNFIGAHGELLGEDKHGDLAGGFDMGDTRLAPQLGDGELIIFGNFFNNLLTGGGADFGGAIDVGRAVFDKL